MSFGTTFAQTTRPVVMGRRGAVVAGHHLAAEIAYDVLRSGGNAMDAAIAAAAALAVLKPDACGAGSDLFLLYSDGRNGGVHALNASGPAPRLARREEFPNGTIAPLGLRAASVPGAVDGWYRAVTRFGSRSLAQALAPAIALAREGMPVSALFASTLAKNAELLRRFPATVATFYPNGAPPEAGDVLEQPELAQTLEAIAADGPAAFYRGAFARALDAAAREERAFLRTDDLADHEGDWREPLRAAYRGYELIGQPPVSVGLAVLEAMQMLENFPIATLADNGAEFIHLHVEATKLAMADVRGHLGDPQFSSHGPVAHLLDPAYTRSRALRIDPRGAGTFEAGDLLARTASDTSYVAVIDKDRNAVSLLQSVFHVFGCGVVVPGTGVLMNNRMTGFSLDPASPNSLEPGKRTMSTLNPLLVRRDGRVATALGTPGGPSQVYTNGILLTRTLDRGLDLQRSLDAPRWFITPEGDLLVEESIAPEVRAELSALGHRVVPLRAHSAAMGGAGIARINAAGVREAGADPRRESYALAY